VIAVKRKRRKYRKDDEGKKKEKVQNAIAVK